MGAIHDAVEAGDVLKVKHLLDVVPELVNDTDVYAWGIAGASIMVGGFTPLHIACQVGEKAIVELLLRAGADVNAKNKMDETPIYFSFTARSLDRNGTTLVELLLAFFMLRR